MLMNKPLLLLVLQQICSKAKPKELSNASIKTAERKSSFEKTL